jgi:hypothetical protein
MLDLSERFFLVGEDGGLAHPNSFGCPVQALLGRGFHFERTRTFGKIPIFSRRRAVHCDSISTVPSAPVK